MFKQYLSLRFENGEYSFDSNADAHTGNLGQENTKISFSDFTLEAHGTNPKMYEPEDTHDVLVQYYRGLSVCVRL